MNQAIWLWLLPRFISTTANPSTGPVWSVSEALTSVMQPRADAPADNTTPGFKGSLTPASMSIPVTWASPVLPMSDIPVVGTPVKQSFFMLTVSLKHKKWDHPTDNAPNDHGHKRAHSATKEANEVRSSETALASSHSSNQPALEPIKPLSSPAKSDAVPEDGMAVDALGSTGGPDRDSAVGISENDTDHSDDESESDWESWESVADSNLESATGDCLTCSDTKETAVRYSHQKFCKKVQASCKLTRWSLLKVSQMVLIDKTHQAVWGSSFSIVNEEWDPTLKEDFSSSEADKMAVWTDQLLWIKEATDVKNIYPREPKADVHGKKKTLVQLLKQFYTHFYQLYERGTICAIVNLLGLHCGSEVFLPLVFQVRWEYWNNCHPPLGRALLDGNGVWYFPDIWHHVCTEHPWPSGEMQSRAWKGPEVPQEKGSPSHEGSMLYAFSYPD